MDEDLEEEEEEEEEEENILLQPDQDVEEKIVEKQEAIPARKKTSKKKKDVSDGGKSESPETERSLKDHVFIFVLITMFFSTLFLDYYCITNGNPGKFIKGYDSWGNVCGEGNNADIPGVSLSGLDRSNQSNAMKIGSFELTKQFSDEKPPFLCVKDCPTNISMCRDFVRSQDYDITDEMINTSICNTRPNIILKHISFLNRCFPTQLIKLIQSSNQTTGSDSTSGDSNDYATFANVVTNSFRKLHGDLVFLTLLPFIFCILSAALLGCFPGVFILGLIVFFGLGSIILTTFLWQVYFTLRSGETQITSQGFEPAVLEASEEVKQIAMNEISEVYNLPDEDSYYNTFIRKSRENPKALLAFNVFVTICTIVILAVIFFIRKSLEKVVVVFKEATHASINNPCIYIQPLVTLLFTLLLVLHYVFILVYIFSIRKIVVDERGFVSYEADEEIPYITLIMIHSVFSLFWWEFALGCEQFIIAAAVAEWYFQRDKSKYCHCVVWPTATPTKDLVKYHLGTVCCAALIITLIGVLKKFFQYLESKLKKKDPSSFLSKICCAACCLEIVDKLFRFLNKNVIICSAIYGYGFCKSAKEAFSLLTGHFAFAALLNGLSWFFLLLGKITVVTLTTLCGTLYFRIKLGSDTPVIEYGAVVLILSFISYFIARCFFSTYDVVLDTLFVCFCDDMKRNDGEIRPHFARPELQSTILTSEEASMKNLSSATKLSTTKLSTTSLKSQSSLE